MVISFQLHSGLYVKTVFRTNLVADQIVVFTIAKYKNFYGGWVGMINDGPGECWRTRRTMPQER